MDKCLTSVGIDVGTTSTQLAVSRLRLQNRSGSFSVPQMDITHRQVVYRSPVHFTPLLGKDRVDAKALGMLIREEYRRAGLRPEDVDSGAVIITGETSRRENARDVVEELSGFAGDFVVATAGPALESVLAAKGAGAAAYSERTGRRVLHMDIGGGTSNLALIDEGKILKTGCLNVGGRLVKFDAEGKICYVSPVLAGLCVLREGERVCRERLEEAADILVQALEMAAGIRKETALLEKLWTKEAGPKWTAEGEWQLSFSGGVAECIRERKNWKEYGDIGPILGDKIRNSRLCAGEYRLSEEAIRATVIGAGSHSLQLSGSTVFCRGMELPIRGRPAVCLTEQEQLDSTVIKRRLAAQDGPGVLAVPGFSAPTYRQVEMLARAIWEGWQENGILVAVEQDMAKALGQRLALLAPEKKILCIDGVRLRPGDYLDIGAPVEMAFPVVVKTLILEPGEHETGGRNGTEDDIAW